jgi:hypothetical protein
LSGVVLHAVALAAFYSSSRRVCHQFAYSHEAKLHNA